MGVSDSFRVQSPSLPFVRPEGMGGVNDPPLHLDKVKRQTKSSKVGKDILPFFFLFLVSEYRPSYSS